jgi:hypothetical protein
MGFVGEPRIERIPAEERIARERRLRRAVLIEAIRCLEGAEDARNRLRLRRQAINWLRGHESSCAFSFLNVCESLGLDPDSVRRAILLRFVGTCLRLTGNQLADIVREHRRGGRVSMPRNGARARREVAVG